jgi:predicted porin
MFAKKNLIAVAALATLAVSAQAQSSVTLYGNLDVGLTSIKEKTAGDSNTTNGVTSSILTESFFGLKGQEDLGGGLKAIFKLESFVNVDTGSVAGNFWGRNAYVGVAGSFGTVALGNQESLFKTEAAAFDAFGLSPVLAVSKLFVGNTLGGSWQNTIGYTSPNLSGLTVSAQHSARESNAAPTTSPTNAVNGGATAIAANYTAGALGLSAVVGDVRSVDATRADERNKAWLLGASYDFGVVKAFAQYGQNKLEDNAGADDGKDKFFQVGAVVPVTQAGALHAAYGQNKNDNAALADSESRKFSLAYHHTLSKRTGVYAGLAYTKAEVGTAETKTTVIAAGLRHAF